MVKFGTSFFRRLILNLSSRCLVGEHRTFLTLCFEGSYGFLDPSTKSCIKNGNHWSLRSRLYICTISHLLVVKKKKPNHFARSKFDRNFTTGLNKLSRIVGSSTHFNAFAICCLEVYRRFSKTRDSALVQNKALGFCRV